MMVMLMIMKVMMMVMIMKVVMMVMTVMMVTQKMIVMVNGEHFRFKGKSFQLHESWMCIGGTKGNIYLLVMVMMMMMII